MGEQQQQQQQQQTKTELIENTKGKFLTEEKPIHQRCAEYTAQAAQLQIDMKPTNCWGRKNAASLKKYCRKRHFRPFWNFDKCRHEAADAVIFGVAVDRIRAKIW